MPHTHTLLYDPPLYLNSLMRLKAIPPMSYNGVVTSRPATVLDLEKSVRQINIAYENNSRLQFLLLLDSETASGGKPVWVDVRRLEWPFEQKKLNSKLKAHLKRKQLPTVSDICVVIFNPVRHHTRGSGPTKNR